MYTVFLAIGELHNGDCVGRTMVGAVDVKKGFKQVQQRDMAFNIRGK